MEDAAACETTYAGRPTVERTMNIPLLHRPPDSLPDDLFVAAVVVVSVLCFVAVLFGMS